MPSSREINEARQRGDAARELLEQALVSGATASRATPSLPTAHVRTQGLANIFAAAYPDQAAPTFQAAPTVDSRTGQQSNALTNANATTDQPAPNPGILITDAHAQQQAPTVMRASSTTHTSQGGRRGRGGRDGGGCGGRGPGAQNQPPADAASRVRAILNNRIAPSARKAYTDYNIRFILWLYDNRHHDIISPTLLEQ